MTITEKALQEANNEPTPSDLKREAVEFAEWIQLHRWKYYGNAQGKWKRPLTPMHTTSKLYDIFKAEKK